jgi:hypothetical protein
MPTNEKKRLIAAAAESEPDALSLTDGRKTAMNPKTHGSRAT